MEYHDEYWTFICNENNFIKAIPTEKNSYGVLTIFYSLSGFEECHGVIREIRDFYSHDKGRKR